MFIANACGLFSFQACGTIPLLLNAIINTLNTLAISLAVVFLAVGAIKYITASGNKEKATEAKTLLTQVLIGVAVILGINLIFNLLTSILGSGGTISRPAAPTV
jgi:hypothetical protein